MLGVHAEASLRVPNGPKWTPSTRIRYEMALLEAQLASATIQTLHERHTRVTGTLVCQHHVGAIL